LAGAFVGAFVLFAVALFAVFATFVVALVTFEFAVG
jgi:hypothetical protein